MLPQIVPESNYLMRMADGTIKQVNPFTGTDVWTVPGRGNRPLGVKTQNPAPLDPKQWDACCAFCPRNYLDTPPEKARLVKTGDKFTTRRHLQVDALFDTVAEFRRIPNLFEIVSFDYWQTVLLADCYGILGFSATAGRNLEFLEAGRGRKYSGVGGDGGRGVVAVLSSGNYSARPRKPARGRPNGRSDQGECDSPRW